MLQVKNGRGAPFKIKSIRKKGDETERSPIGAACTIDAGDGTDKPPC